MKQSSPSSCTVDIIITVITHCIAITITITITLILNNHSLGVVSCLPTPEGLDPGTRFSHLLHIHLNPLLLLLFPAGEHKELLSELMIITVEMLNTKQHNNSVFAKIVQLCAFLNTTPCVVTVVANTTIFIQRHSFNNAAAHLPKTTIKHYQY